MTTVTATGVSAASQALLNGSTTLTLTNTSNFIGTVFIEISKDGGKSWVANNTPATQGTMVAGPLVNDIPLAPSVLMRLNCTKYTSGTLTYSFAPATVPLIPAATGPLAVTALGIGALVTITSGAGAPSSVQPNGSLYLRTDGTTNTRLYISNGSTWVAVSSS